MTDAQSSEETYECNQPDCTESFPSIMRMVAHTVSAHGDDDAAEKLIDEILERSGEGVLD